jgi:hypothetical protein
MSLPEPKTWTIHLAARKPGKAVLAVLLFIFALAGIAMLVPAQWGAGGMLLLLALAAVLLFGSIAEFLLPVTYTLNAAGAQARHLGSQRILPWSRVRRVYLYRNGIKLSPLPLRGWAEQYRGVLLRTPERDAVLAAVQAWLTASGMTPEFIEET